MKEFKKIKMQTAGLIFLALAVILVVVGIALIIQNKKIVGGIELGRGIGLVAILLAFGFSAIGIYGTGFGDLYDLLMKQEEEIKLLNEKLISQK